MKVVRLVLITTAIWFVLSVIAEGMTDHNPWFASSLSFIICLLPAMGTIAIVGAMENRSPVEAIGSVLIAPIVRLAAVVFLGTITYSVMPAVKLEIVPIIVWICVYYLLTLVVETALLLPKKRSAATPTKVDSPQP